MTNNTFSSFDPCQNVNAIIDERNQLINSCANLSMQNQSYQNQLNTVVAQASGMYIADQNTIAYLRGTIESMKSQREVASRTFQQDSSGITWCIEPSSKKKEVGYIHFNSYFLLVSVIDGMKNESIVICYKAVLTDSEIVVIPFEDITEKKLIKYFSKFKIVCKKDIANDCLYNMIIDALSNCYNNGMYIPEFPGIVLKTSDTGIEEAEFLCSESKFPDTFYYSISDAYLEKHLLFTNKSVDKIYDDLKPYICSNIEQFLIVYSCAGIISTYLKHIHCNSIPLLSVEFTSSDSKLLSGIFLKTYFRNIPPKPLNMSKFDLTSTLDNCNDETLVLVDDTISETHCKRLKSIDTILNYKSDTYCKPFNIAILSNEIQYYLNPGDGIHLEPDENFGKGYSADERFQLSKYLDEMTRVFAETFCKHIDEYNTFLKKSITDIKAYEKNTFISGDYFTAYAVLLSVYYLWVQIFHAETNENYKGYLKNIFKQSQDIEGGKTFSIINSFTKILNSIITNKKVKIVNLGRDMKYKFGNDTIIVDGDLMLMEESVIKKYFLPEITEVQTVNGILNTLSKQEYLVATNGHKKPTTVYDEYGTPTHINLIAVKYTEIVSSETIKYIDNLSSACYFAEAPVSDKFLPLVQNVFGHQAGQFIISGENQHRCITGKSGIGKSVFMTQTMARLALKGERVIVFDSSNSFSETEMRKSLSGDFIDNNITFYDVSNTGLPVDIMYTYEDCTITKQKNMLAAIISEAMPDSSPIQINFLKKVLKEYIKKYNHDYDNFLYAILEEIKEVQTTTRDSVYNKLNDVFEEILDCDDGTVKKDWFSFLSNCKNITVIKIDEPGGHNQKPITNMLLASLYYAQMYQDVKNPLNIFIDEVQNENLSDENIISKILREGRKDNIGLNISTQYIGNGKEKHILRQAGVNVYFKPEDSSSIKALATALGLRKNEIWKIESMSKGECYIQGPIVNFSTNDRDETVISGKTCLLPDSPLLNK